MLPKELRHLSLIPASSIMQTPEIMPEQSGTYLFFANGGTRILDVAGYFRTDDWRPLDAQGCQHLYTGAANDLRRRMKQHFCRDWRSSSFRASLHALERAKRAVSMTRTPACEIRNERTLTAWLDKNVIVAFEQINAPFDRERSLIRRYASPLNITQRRSHPFAKRLCDWRKRMFSGSLPAGWYN